MIYYPWKFFFYALTISSTFYFLAAYASFYSELHYLLFPLILAGMSGPTISALVVLTQSKSKALWKDFLQRLKFNKIRPIFIPIILLFLPCLVLFSIAISLIFGYSPTQFALATLPPDQALQGQNFVSLILVILFSVSLEELGWHGYGIDSLMSKFNLFKSSLIFGSIWSLWHVPAFFIKNGYFQNEVWNQGIIYVVTYFATLFAAAILINWVYVKNNRSILIAILAHTMLNISGGLLFQIQPITKIILMLFLVAISVILVFVEQKLFFENKFK